MRIKINIGTSTELIARLRCFNSVYWNEFISSIEEGLEGETLLHAHAAGMAACAAEDALSASYGLTIKCSHGQLVKNHQLQDGGAILYHSHSGNEYRIDRYRDGSWEISFPILSSIGPELADDKSRDELRRIYDAMVKLVDLGYVWG